MTKHFNASTYAEITPKITVLGCGREGIDTVNFMIISGFEGVHFMSVDDEEQVLNASKAHLNLNYEKEKILYHLKDTHLLFIIAGFGETFGEWHAHLISRLAQKLGIVTMGLVIKPPAAHQAHRAPILELSIKRFYRSDDSLLAIPSEGNSNETCIALITTFTNHLLREQVIGLDFADIKAVVVGTAMLGFGQASGENRAMKAAESALNHPLINSNRLKNATGLLISITGGTMSIDEIDAAATRIQQEFSQAVKSVIGASFIASLEDKMRVAVFITQNTP